MDQNFMKEKKVLPLVLSMSLPMMLSMLINSLYNIIDSMFVARVGEKALQSHFSWEWENIKKRIRAPLRGCF